MLEIYRSYAKPELAQMLGTRSKQGIDRKLQRYDISFSVSGWGDAATYTILSISDRFKIYAILELGCGGTTDFRKLRNVYYHFFEDEVFRAMPDEVKEVKLHEIGEGVSRQAIAGYIQKLTNREMISRHTDNFIYYFAKGQQQRLVERAEYTAAWREYWRDRHLGLDSGDAIFRMFMKYGGVARKQAIPAINGIYNKEIEYMLSLIQESIEREVSG